MVEVEWEQRRKYSLLQADILPKLGHRDFFVDAVIHNYILAAHRVGLFPSCSKRRIIEAYQFWQTDIERTLHQGTDERTLQLDHFKHASFIAFWLRRMTPINTISVIAPRGTDISDDRYDRRQRYFIFGNELSAFLIGYKICINYELGMLYKQGELAVKAKRADIISAYELPDRLLQDYLMLWKHKNMSPYAFYLMYKSLFQSRGGLALGLREELGEEESEL